MIEIDNRETLKTKLYDKRLDFPILDCPFGFLTFSTGITSLLGVKRVTKAV